MAALSPLMKLVRRKSGAVAVVAAVDSVAVAVVVAASAAVAVVVAVAADSVVVAVAAADLAVVTKPRLDLRQIFRRLPFLGLASFFFGSGGYFLGVVRARPFAKNETTTTVPRKVADLVNWPGSVPRNAMRWKISWTPALNRQLAAVA
jgi:hypothetical protein